MPLLDPALAFSRFEELRYKALPCLPDFVDSFAQHPDLVQETFADIYRGHGPLGKEHEQRLIDALAPIAEECGYCLKEPEAFLALDVFAKSILFEEALVRKRPEMQRAYETGGRAALEKRAMQNPLGYDHLVQFDRLLLEPEATLARGIGYTRMIQEHARIKAQAESVQEKMAAEKTVSVKELTGLRQSLEAALRDSTIMEHRCDFRQWGWLVHLSAWQRGLPWNRVLPPQETFNPLCEGHLVSLQSLTEGRDDAGL